MRSIWLQPSWHSESISVMASTSMVTHVVPTYATGVMRALKGQTCAVLCNETLRVGSLLWNCYPIHCFRGGCSGSLQWYKGHWFSPCSFNVEMSLSPCVSSSHLQLKVWNYPPQNNNCCFFVLYHGVRRILLVPIISRCQRKVNIGICPTSQ